MGMQIDTHNSMLFFRIRDNTQITRGYLLSLSDQAEDKEGELAAKIISAWDKTRRCFIDSSLSPLSHPLRSLVQGGETPVKRLDVCKGLLESRSEKARRDNIEIGVQIHKIIRQQGFTLLRKLIDDYVINTIELEKLIFKQHCRDVEHRDFFIIERNHIDGLHDILNEFHLTLESRKLKPI